MVDAIGEEIAANLAGENHTVNDVTDMCLWTLAAREDNQVQLSQRTSCTLTMTALRWGMWWGYDGSEASPNCAAPFFDTVTEKLGHHFGRSGG